MSRNKDLPTITVAVPPQRLGWLCRELDAQSVPYRDDGRGNLTTLEMAQPIVDQVLGYQPQQTSRRRGLDTITASLCHVLLLILAVTLFWVGIWEAALVALAGELLWRFVDVRKEHAYRRAEAAGYAGRIAGDRRSDVLFNLAIAAVLTYSIWFFASKALGVL